MSVLRWERSHVCIVLYCSKCDLVEVYYCGQVTVWKLSEEESHNNYLDVALIAEDNNRKA